MGRVRLCHAAATNHRRLGGVTSQEAPQASERGESLLDPGTGPAVHEQLVEEWVFCTHGECDCHTEDECGCRTDTAMSLPG